MNDILIGAIATLSFLVYTGLLIYIGTRLAIKFHAKPEPVIVSKEQDEIKRKREKLEDQFGKIFTYKRG